MGEIRLDDCCRLCLKEGFSLTNIFLQNSTAGDPLFRILNSIYELTISENDGLPSQICYPCMWRMIEFDACKKNVRSAEVEIRRLINQIRPHMNKVSSDGAVVMNRGTKLVGANEVGIEHVTVHSEVPIKEEIDIEEWEMPVETSMEAPETCQHFEEGDEDDYHEIESTELAPEEISAEEFEGNGNEHVFCQPLREGPNLSEVVSSLYVDDNEDVVNSTFEDRICIDNTTGISVKQEVSGRMFEEEDVTDTELVRKEFESGIQPKRSKDALASEFTSSKINLCNSRKEYFCDVCKKSFTRKYALRQHARVHHHNNLYSCNVCGKKFKQDRGRRDHELKHVREESNNGKGGTGSTGKLYSCHVCEKQFKVKSSLHDHLNIHSNKYSCHSCGKSFGCLSHLKAHSRTHSNETPYKCHVCLKSFNQKSNFKQHMAYHSSERPFLCSVCDQKFKTKKDKTQHELLHLRKK